MNTSDPVYGEPWIASLASRLSPAARVADLGCGPGRDSALLQRHGFSTVSMDFSLGMLRAGLADFEGPRIQGDLRWLPFADASFDGVWANACLLHLSAPDLALALAEIVRVLRPGGWMGTSVKGGAGDEWEDQRYGVPRWFKYWSESEFDACLETAGFEIYEAAYDDIRSQPWIIRIAQRAS